MKIMFVFLILSLGFLFACSEESSFDTCESGTVAGLSDLSAVNESSSFCRTIEGEVAYEFTGYCQRKGCFFLYDLNDDNSRGSSIYLSDTTDFPSSWKDSSKTHVTRVTGEYFPARVPCDELNNQDCQRAFFVVDVDD